MSKKLILGVLGTSAIIATGAIVGTVFLVKNALKTKSADSIIGNYKLETTAEFDHSQVLASDFCYKSYTDDSTNNEPTLQLGTEARKYWPQQVETKPFYNDTQSVEDKTNFDKKFKLFDTKTQAPIDVIKNDYLIHYHSYANDETGTLYLAISLEEKLYYNQNPTLEIEKRKQNWVTKVFEVSGFKRVASEDLINKPNVKSWNITARDNLRQVFNSEFENTAKYDSVEKWFASLSHQEYMNNDANKDLIKQQITDAKYYFNIDSKDSYLNPIYVLDEERSIWFTQKDKVNNPNVVTINYYLKRIVPVATQDNLLATTMKPIDQVFSKDLNINYFELKELSKNISIKVLNANDISKVSPVDIYKTKSSGDDSRIYHNNSNGWLESLDLVFDDANNANKYTLKYNNDNIKNKLDKKEDLSFQGKPVVKYDTKTGEAWFSYSLKTKDGYDVSGISEFIGVIKVEGFKVQGE